jgi:protocatechuate 3,4-dioxygenase beta subunit
VRDATGQPVASATVAIFDSGGFEERSRILSPSRAVLRSCERRVTTDSAGAFTVRGLPAGALDLAVGSQGFQVALLPVQVPLQQEIEIVLLAREGKRGALTGRFLGANEKPLSGAIVRAIDPDGYVSEAMSDADGRFTFSTLQPGSYKLGVSVLGGSEARSWTCKQPFQPGEENIVLRTPWSVP